MGLDHVMDFTRLRALGTLFSLLNQAVRNVLAYNNGHADFPMKVCVAECGCVCACVCVAQPRRYGRVQNTNLLTCGYLWITCGVNPKVAMQPQILGHAALPRAESSILFEEEPGHVSVARGGNIHLVWIFQRRD